MEKYGSWSPVNQDFSPGKGWMQPSEPKSNDVN